MQATDDAHANEVVPARRRAYFFVVGVVVLVLHNLVHELVHLVAAFAFGEPVLAFRFLTNGWGTSQVLFATPVELRSGWQWIVIAWTPSAVTTVIGFALFAARRRLLGTWKVWNTALFFAAAYFMMLDPFYMGVLSYLVGGDAGAAVAVGMPLWPVRLVAVAALIPGILAFLWWQGEARREPERYA